MKARSREIVEYTLFDAPRAQDVADIQERREIEARYQGVRLLNLSDPRWVYGAASNPSRSEIKPGDYLVTKPGLGTAVVDGHWFRENYEPVETE
jgi:hypothetical protein